MKLLICTQAVDREDPVLGFFHRWIQEFALHAEQVTVICLREGVHNLPANVTVHSLGKERGSRPSVVYALRFLRHVYALRQRYEVVFVHMNPEYVLLGGVLWRLFKKQVTLWYVHRSATWRLRIAMWFVHHVLTASRESFPLATSKLSVLGHGIPIESFTSEARSRERSSVLRIVTIGRVSETKRIQEMIAAIRNLHRQGTPCMFTVIGSPATPADRRYDELLRAELITDPLQDYVRFLGPISHDKVPRALAGYDVFLNLSRTESLDKAVLEALAAGIPVVTTNTAFRPLLEPYRLFVPEAAPAALANAIVQARKIDLAALVQKVQREHSLSQLILRILEVLRS